MFLGQFNLAVDDAGRIAIPKRVIEGSKDGFFWASDIDGCLTLWRPEEVREHLRQMETLLLSVDPYERRLAQTFIAQLDRAEIRVGSRTEVPHPLRRYAQLTNRAVLVGMVDHLELWEPSLWRRVREAGEQALHGESVPDLDPSQAGRSSEPATLLYYPAILSPGGAPTQRDDGLGDPSYRRISQTIASLMQSEKLSAQDLHKIDPRDFEELVAELLAGQGFEVQTTSYSKDGGVDLWVARDDSLGSFLYAVQCKRHSPRNPVGVEVVRELLGVVSMTGATAGLIVTSSLFTKGARAIANAEHTRHKMSLRDYRDIDDWLRKYGRLSSPARQ